MKKTTKMLDAVRENRKKFQGSSVFFQTWVILLLLFFLGSLLFVVSLNRVESAHRREVACQSNLELLSGASEIAEVGLYNARADLGAIIWNTDVTNFFMDPERPDAQRQYRIKQAFSRVLKADDWTRSFWLYSQLSGQVLTTDGELVAKEDFPESRILEKEEWNAVPSNPDEPGKNAELLLLDGRLFWVEPFVTNRPIGFLCIEMDMETLCRRIFTEETDEIGLYDDQGNLLSPAGLVPGLPASVSLEEPGRFVTKTDQDPGHAQYYLTENAGLSLYFLKKVDRSAFETSILHALRAAIPIILILGAVTLLASYLLATRIFRPINYLVRQVLGRASDQEAGSGAKNELDYLELSYFRAMDQNKAMKGRLEHFSKEIEEQSFRQLLQGKSEEEAGVAFLDEETLATWENGRKMCVIACRRRGSWNVSDSFLDSQLFHVTIAGVLKKNEALSCRTMSMGTCLEAILVCGGKEESVNSMKQKMQTLVQELREVFQPSDCEIITGEGSIVTERSRLAASWSEALHQVDYRLYQEGNDSQDRAQATEAEIAENQTRAFYLERWKRILKHAFTEDREAAQKEMDENLDDFFQGNPSLPDMVQFYRQSVSAMTERLLTEYNIRLSSVPEMEEEQLAAMTPAEQKKWIRHQLDSVLQQADVFFRKKSNRYVGDAMNYIRDHYENRDLSVQDVAEHLGITSNYFSTLFHEATGSSFVAYLNQVRVEQAGYLLAQTKIPIGDIGFRCGFNTVQHFNRTFKKIEGMPPSQYRNTKS